MFVCSEQRAGNSLQYVPFCHWPVKRSTLYLPNGLEVCLSALINRFSARSTSWHFLRYLHQFAIPMALSQHHQRLDRSFGQLLQTPRARKMCRSTSSRNCIDLTLAYRYQMVFGPMRWSGSQTSSYLGWLSWACLLQVKWTKITTSYSSSDLEHTPRL